MQPRDQLKSQDQVRKKTKCCCPNSLEISLFWSEKLFIIVQVLQLFAFTYQANYINFPRRWRGIYTSTYLSLLGGDLGSLIYSQSQSTSSVFRLSYSAFWLLLTVFLEALPIVTYYLFSFSNLSKKRLLKKYLYIIDFLYFPICLSLVPTALCQQSNCEFTISQSSISLFTVLLSSGFLLGYPVWLIREINSQIIMFLSVEHENLVRIKEIEYELGITHSWLNAKYFLFSNYRLTFFRVYYKPIYFLLVLAMVVVHGMFNTQYTLKMMILTLMMTGTSLYVTLFPVYRCWSSCALQIFSFWVISSNMMISYLKDSGYDSQYLEDGNLVEILWSMNALAACLFGTLLVIILITKCDWPVTKNEVRLLESSYRFMIGDLQNAEEMVLRLKALNSYLLVKPSAIAKMIEILSEHFELLKREEHNLQYTVLEQMEVLYYYQEQVLEQSLFPSRKLEKNLKIVISVVQRRWHEQMLMNPIKRKILLKILALNLFFNNKATLPFTSGNNEEDFYSDFGFKSNEKHHAASETTFTGMNDTQIAVDEKYLIDSSRQLKEIQFAVTRKNVRKLIELTENYVENLDLDLIEELRDAWDAVGREMLPIHLYEKLYAEDIEIELS